MAMNDLVERIKASIGNPDSELWFPELTADLAACGWERLRRDIGLTPDSYGTERVLSHSVSAPRNIIGSLTTYPFIEPRPTISIEALSQQCAAEYEEKGISFYSPSEIVQTTVLSSIEEALAIIKQVPRLMRTVAVLVWCLHVIRPEDEEHDVSLSETHAPFSIFVSVPEKRIANDSVRIAEAIVHEAMHLQLTLIEQVIPLVKTTQGKLFSPWRATYRPVQGVLHGVYVFRVIDSFLAKLSSVGISSRYVEDRRGTINNQIRDARSLQDSPDLTLVGHHLTQRLIDSLNSRVYKAPFAS
jgi:hypothetical protein